VSRLLARLGGFIPHSGGWSQTFADVFFDLSDDESLDAQAMALPPTNSPLPGWSLSHAGDTLRLSPSYSTKSAVVISFANPGSGGARNYTIVLRTPRTAATTQATTRP
jgi:hypothetical protein